MYQELACTRSWQKPRLNLPIFFCPLVNDLSLDGYPTYQTLRSYKLL